MSLSARFFAYMKYVAIVFVFLTAGIDVPIKRIPTKMKEAKIIEMVLFQLNEGVDLAEGKKAMKALNQFVRNQPGFIKRETSLADDGHFLDLVHWTDLASAQTASEKAMQEASLLPHFAVIQQESMLLKHFEIFQSSGIKSAE